MVQTAKGLPYLFLGTLRHAPREPIGGDPGVKESPPMSLNEEGLGWQIKQARDLDCYGSGLRSCLNDPGPLIRRRQIDRSIQLEKDRIGEALKLDRGFSELRERRENAVALKRADDLLVG